MYDVLQGNWATSRMWGQNTNGNFRMIIFILDHSVCTTGQLGYIKDVGAEYKWDNLRQAPMMSSPVIYTVGLLSHY